MSDSRFKVKGSHISASHNAVVSGGTYGVVIELDSTPAVTPERTLPPANESKTEMPGGSAPTSCDDIEDEDLSAILSRLSHGLDVTGSSISATGGTVIAPVCGVFIKSGSREKQAGSHAAITV